MIFILFILFVILLRIAELFVARRNEKWMLQNGAVEYGKKHYPFIVALHSLFFVSLFVEYSMLQHPSFSLVLLLIYILLIAFKIWVIASLGKYWNTKIFRIQNTPLIKKGIYKYIKHPNYLIVVAEIALIPLIFQLYCTAIVFTLFNAIMLTVRIREENLALRN